MAGIGDKSAAAGHAVSGREAYLRASTYYRTSYFPLYGKPVDPCLVEAFERETDAFQKAAPLFSPPIEVLEIPFEDGSPRLLRLGRRLGQAAAHDPPDERLRLDHKRDVLLPRAGRDPARLQFPLL